MHSACNDHKMINFLDYESTRNETVIARDQFDLSAESPIGKKIESAGEGPNTFAEANLSPYRHVWKNTMTMRGSMGL